MFTADMICSHWLKWFVGSDDTPEWTRTVFRLADGSFAATDGRVAVVTAEQMPFDVPAPDAKLAARTDHVAKYLAIPAEKSITMSCETVLEMFGACKHPAIGKCNNCKGKGEVSHDCDCDLCEKDTEPCENCDGTGKAESIPDKRYVSLWNHPIDANLISYVLAHAPAAEQYALEIYPQTSDYHLLRIVTPTWTAIIVMLTASLMREHDCRELIPEAATCSAK